MANEYITAAEVKATLSLTGDSYADADIQTAIEAASRAVDNETGRTFYPADQVRYYTVSPADTTIVLYDVIAITEIAVDAGDRTWTTVLVEDVDYIIESVDAPDVTITLIGGGTLGVFPTTHSAIRVTGTFGWAAPPAGVIAATQLLANRLLRRLREAPLGVVSLGVDQGVARVMASDPDVSMLLGPYTLHAVSVG